MEFHEPARLPRGFACASRHVGLKPKEPDLAVFYSEVDAPAAALFTRNHVVGAPVAVGRELMRAGVLRAIVVNSKIANVGMGEQGLADARRMGELAARELDVAPEGVLMSSTGVIGVRLPMDRIERGLQGIARELQEDPVVGVRGMMTTDTHPKALSCSIGSCVLTIVAKGSGMIEPHLATTLIYMFTDARFAADELREMLRAAADVSYNMLSVDSDTSTSDTCVLMANGLAGAVDRAAFAEGLQSACVRMAETLARDGEGASKLLRARVRGARSLADARRVAKSIINSPLVKTMAYGADPNLGRVLMAVGKCFECDIDPTRLGIRLNGVPVYEAGARVEIRNEPELRRLLAGDPVDIDVDLGLGDFAATAFGCDLTHGYIDENAAYYST